MSEEDFSTENIPQSNWMKFSKIGDYIKGTFVEQNLKKGDGDFRDQQVYKLINCEAVIDGKKSLEKEFNAGIGSDYVNSRLKNIVPGQRIGIKFDKEIPPTRKGYKPAKSLIPYVWGIDPTYKGSEEFKKDINFEG